MDRKSINKGRQLKFAREYRKYTQARLCKDVKGLSQSNLSKYEKGFDGMLKDNKIAEIMQLLNFPLQFLDVKMPELYTSWDL
jgi:transcriptional regulator with XRE-family HTH domain